MKTISRFALKSILLLSIACSLSLGVHSCKTDNIIADTIALGPPVETEPAETNYEPAFVGQTRAPGVTSSPGYTATAIISSLQNPWGITGLPDGRLLITEKGGTLRIATSAGELSPAIIGLPSVDAAGQGGLLGLCIDPDFSANRLIYWVFSESQAGGSVTAVAKGVLSLDESKVENVTVIYRATPAFAGSLHYGGRIVFDRSGFLIVSTGERSSLVTRPQAQDVSSSLGKLVRIAKDGSPAVGNPSFGQGNAKPELYSIGHRNPQGLAIHPTTGDIWQSEHGPRGGDELNHITAGANYGWPTITYGIEYSGQSIGDAIQQKDGMEQPVYYWDPVVSPSGMTFYSHNHLPQWRNNLFIASLSGQHIIRLVIRDNKVVGEERLLAGENQRFRDVAQGKDGALYAITDQGRLYRIY
ncbi:PQQ-dependent sugar dehydrogenase [Sphingobacterium griseoflavum]|uniref:Glucose dehydrogenase n=1 Tax=Sphingobacterium griseoflavum TaxID=1474952 RepID=A0ABQ3HWU4_9SPHI|nr:PQQ-dependent sugar dehydrogenase [Sphingobacterium griseoflavum]GHE42450.1 glucose dehydrogenase [Sphingobacterium griseoflavum]